MEAAGAHILRYRALNLKYLSPLIVALKMDAASKAKLSDWRQRFFPLARNYLDAHLTLYHHLPAEHLPWIESQIRLQILEEKAFPLSFSRLDHTGGFVSVVAEAPEIFSIKKSLDATFAALLKPQDQQIIRPHVTLVNKVTPDEALAAHEKIASEFFPWTGEALGLEIHFYRHGPWEWYQDVLFKI